MNIKRLLVICILIVFVFLLIGYLLKSTSVNKGDNNSNIDINNETDNDIDMNTNKNNDEMYDEFMLSIMPSEEMKSLAQSINKKANINLDNQILMKITPVSAKSDLGISSEEFDMYIEDSIKCEPQIMTTNHSLCFVKVKEGMDVIRVKNLIFNNCDLNKWICTMAEKAIVTHSGNYIMLVMSDTKKCDKLYKAFTKHFELQDENNQRDKFDKSDKLEKFSTDEF